MEKLTNTQTHYTNDDKWPTGLTTVEDAAESIGISADRLLELADSHFAPHWRIDGGQPLFQKAEIKRWAAKNLLTRIDGNDLSINLKVMVDPPIAKEAPPSIREIENLRVMPINEAPPGVYFLVHKNKVVYIGQSISPLARISSHTINGKKFDSAFLVPVPSYALDAVEGALIRALKPPLNGGESRKKSGNLMAPGNSIEDQSAINKFCPGLTNKSQYEYNISEK